MMERRPAFVATLALVVASSFVSYYAGAAGVFPKLSAHLPLMGVPRSEGTASGQGLDVRQIQRVQRYIQSQFVEPVTDEKLTQGALKGMVEATGDKYSAYFPPKEYKSFLEHFESSFSGIGVRVETNAKNGLVTVVAPIKGSPGEQAGLRAGDAILTVEGKDITKMPMDQAVNLIKGPKGTKVTLTVKREGVAEPLKFVITRAVIAQPSIEFLMVDKAAGVGYIQLMEFNKDIGARTRAAITELKAQGMTRLILDLRQNPGGLLDEAVNVSSLFVPAKSPVVHIVYRNGREETKESKAKENWQTPLVVLVDGGSASASEIVAGAIKDLKVGTLIGAKTFGKGSVQSFFDLESGEQGGVKLTTAKYLTAGRNSIHEKGIEPDITVENAQKVLPRDAGDDQLAAAIRFLKSK